MSSEDFQKFIAQRFDVLKSPEDKCSYRGLSLTNGLKVLLISDPEADKAAAALDVKVGHMSDPDDIPGLAHFLEHMLFLGTKKYPDEDEYNQFLSQHAGNSNAYTSSVSTNYYFDVALDSLEGALDRFAQFFLEPLFTESATMREACAVHSEHTKNIAQDDWRFSQIKRLLSEPGHPYSKFGTGNTDTLVEIPKSKGINVREELLKFHDKWYSANIMSLSILSKVSLDELEKLAVELFKDLVNKEITAPFFSDHPYQSTYAKTYLFMETLKDKRKLNLYFPTQCFIQHYKSNPPSYLSHLIGHEGKGSLLSELKAKKWGNALACRHSNDIQGFGFLEIKIDLTEEGLSHIDDVIEVFFQYIKMIRDKDGIQKWLFDEMKIIQATEFRFQENRVAQDLVCELSSKLQNYPIEEVLTAEHLITDWRPEMVKGILDLILPENIYIIIEAKKFNLSPTETEPWYGTKYVTSPVAEETIARWQNVTLSPNLAFPEKNLFIADDLNLVERDTEDQAPHPFLIEETNIHRLWFKQDQTFNQPKSEVYIMFMIPPSVVDPVELVVRTLWFDLLFDDLCEDLYVGSLAGIRHSCIQNHGHYLLTIGGFQQKQHVYLEKILSTMVSFVPKEDRYEALRLNQECRLKNVKLAPPASHAVSEADFLGVSAWLRTDDAIDAMAFVTYEKVKEFGLKLLETPLFIDMFAYGNLTPESALKLSEVVLKYFGKCRPRSKLSIFHSRIRGIMLETGTNLYTKISNDIHKDNAILSVMQCGVHNIKQTAILDVFQQISSSHCYNVLRTKEQLGYGVWSWTCRKGNIIDYIITVQSEKKPEYLDQRIEAYLAHLFTLIDQMTDDEFEGYKKAVIVRILEKPKRIGKMASRLWLEIETSCYIFDRREKIAEAVKTLTKDDILNMYNLYIAPGSQVRKKLAVHVMSTLSPDETLCEPGEDVPATLPKVEILDTISFKSQQFLAPLPPVPESLSVFARPVKKKSPELM